LAKIEELVGYVFFVCYANDDLYAAHFVGRVLR